ncbi:integrase domain-containing protein [Acidithiobacillus ferriphilus]|uniref:integrase domain-containing protein n=1 Tax=Acidithiobacillus ferriphilus TaxID=1689834 RepID=UPI002DBD4C3F|nr:integrase domain-containing protein [Acidithiobacillus ferriphilus]MEB8536883.1 integrase domain-containing protein [Acidithiobacillus ferriphilus]
MKRFIHQNYGLAFSLERACQIAIQRGNKGYGSIRTKQKRIQYFTEFLKTSGIKDLRKVRYADLQSFGEHVAQLAKTQNWSTAYAQNILADANVLMGFVRRQRSFRIRPCAYVGQRGWTRSNPPTGMSMSDIEQCAHALFKNGGERAALILLMARFFGMRLQEAVKADLPRLLRQAKREGRINILEGTKGGRKVARLVTINDFGIWILQQAHDLAREDHGRCLIPQDQNYICFIRSEIARARQVMKTFEIKGFHDLRSAYSCDRYTQIAGVPAPVFTAGRTTRGELDHNARVVISAELGHRRPEVVNSYIGARKPAPEFSDIDRAEQARLKREMTELQAPVTEASLSCLLRSTFKGPKSECRIHLRRVSDMLLPYCRAHAIHRLGEITLQNLQEMVRSETIGHENRSRKTQQDYLLSLLRFAHALGHAEWELPIREAAGFVKKTQAGRQLKINRRRFRDNKNQ